MIKQPQLIKPTFIKLKDIERGRNGYNVYVKILSTQQKNVPTKQGTNILMINALVGDQTGTAKAFFKGSQTSFIKPNKVIAIRNGLRKIVKGHISLQLDAFGRATEQKIEIKANESLNISDSEFKQQNFRDRNQRNNRGFNNRNNRGGRRNFNNNRDRTYEKDRGNKKDYDAPRNKTLQRRPPRQNRYEDNNNKPRNYNNDNKPQRNYNNNDNRPQRNYNNSDNRPQRNYNDQDNRPQKRNDYNRPPRQHQNRDRDFDRRPAKNNYQEKKQQSRYEEKRSDNRERRAPLQWTKIKEITPGQDNINLIVKIKSCKLIGDKRPMMRCVIGDETGISNAFLPGDKNLAVGSSIALFNVQAKVIKEHIQLQLSRNGRIDTARRQVSEIEEDYDLSQKAWVPVD